MFLLDFINQSSSLDFHDIFTTEKISIDDEELNTINPDDFLNESFFKTESEVVHERNKTNSESSGPINLTPPISPQPNNNNINNNLNVQLIPIASFIPKSYCPIIITTPQQLQQQHQNQNQQRKVKPILPAKSITSGSSDSEASNVINDNNSNNSSKASSPIDKILIKKARLIRNRESALQSRRKKKEYVQNLEVEIGNLKKELLQLKEENSQLKARLMSYTNFTCRCASSITSKLATVKSTSLLLAFVFMLCINIIPMGGYFTITNHIQKSMTQTNKINSFNSRHLLFVENGSNENNDTSIEGNSNDEIPLYFNQTDRIRKANIENVLRWIPQPDLFNTSKIFMKEYDFSEDPLQEKLAKMYEKSREQLKKNSSTNKKKTKKNVSAEKKATGNIQQNLYNPSFFKLHEFFDEIKRKDDTFYVFSFKGEHMLLPALHTQNFSQIVKMNLIMPRNNGKY